MLSVPVGGLCARILLLILCLKNGLIWLYSHVFLFSLSIFYAADDSPPSRDGGGGRKRLKQGRKSGREDRDNRDDGGRNNRKTSLRVGGGRSGRAATLTSRRGSLKKRDRTAEREAREEAAIERRTVSLPEYVFRGCARMHVESCPQCIPGFSRVTPILSA